MRWYLSRNCSSKTKIFDDGLKWPSELKIGQVRSDHVQRKVSQPSAKERLDRQFDIAKLNRAIPA